MKSFKKALCLVLIAVLVLSFPLCALATNAQPLSYVVLGSSQTNGYGLRGYVDERFYNWNGSAAQSAAWALAPFSPELSAWNARERMSVSISGYRNLVPGCYPDVLAGYLRAEGFDVTVHQLAQSSMRAEELTVLLDPSFDGDEFTDWRFSEDGSQKWFARDGGLELLREDYRSTIADADIITYDLGANNFGAYLGSQLTSPDFSTTDLHNVIDPNLATLFYSLRETIQKGIDALLGSPISPEDTAFLYNAADTFAYAVLGFIKHFDLNMQLIYQLNPDVDLTVVSIQNAVSGCELSLSGIPISLGDLLQVPISICNAYMAGQSKYCSQYTYTDISKGGRVTANLDDLKAYRGPEDLTTNLFDCFNVYDNNIFLAERVTRALEALGYVREAPENAELYQRAYTAATDTMTQLFAYAQNTASADISGLFDGNERVPLDAIIQGSIDAAIAAANGEDYSGILANTITAYDAQSEADKAYFVFCIWTDFGNTYFGHPSLEGHREAADIVYGAMKEKTKGRTVLLRALMNLREDLTAQGVRYGVKYASVLFAKLAEAFKVDNLYNSFIKALPSSWDSDFFAEYILALINGEDEQAIAKLKEAMEQARAEMETPAHVHSAIRIPSSKALFLKPGNIEYYRCLKCGKCYLDKELTQEVPFAKTILPAKLKLF